MKIKKILLLISLILVIFISCNVKTNADIGPKPSITIDIVGIEGDYVVAFASNKVSGPHYDYETWKQYEIDQEYNPIMEYKDEDGYKWMSRVYKCNGPSTISFSYYAPYNFKLVIYKNDQLYKVTDIITRYAFSTYYEMDFSNEEIKIKNTYPYFTEILKLLFRIIMTLIIEIGLFFIFRLYTKRNLKIVIIVNIFTQVALNVILNLVTYYSGGLSAFLLLFLLELIIFIIEPIVYIIFMKDKKKWLIVIYGVLANILSFIIGFIYYGIM